MAQASGLTEMLVVPASGHDAQRNDTMPVVKWVLAVVIASIVATVVGGLWLVQEILAVHSVASSSSPWEFLMDLGRGGSFKVLALPLLVIGVVWAILIFIALRSVRSWGGALIQSATSAREQFEQQLQESEGKLGLANAAVEFWKGQARDASDKARAASAARSDLEGRMDQLAAREKTLAREQDQLSRSKDRLEKHVEARTIELHRLQQRYVSILEGAGEGICSCNLEGEITFANPAAASMMGWSTEELLGQVESIVFADHAEKKPAGEEEELHGQAPHASPIVFRRKDDTTFPVEVVRTPVQEAGRRVGTVLIFKDVTERTEADERFSAKVAELARSNSELEQFAFVASHDLQEPLRKIQAFGDRLKARVADNLTPEASDYLGRMQSAAARMQGLIDGLLMYSRVLTRAQPFTQVPLKTVVNEVVEDLEVRIEKTGAQVEVGELPSIEADALQIRQLLQNLIGNALKFQPAGNTPQVTISARTVSGARWANETSGSTELLTKREMCELTVSDNGIGFDEAYLKRLFVVFQRLHSRSEFEGTGIGLAVCRKIATRHGGFITAKSRPGQGATFMVLLPLKQQANVGGTS
jgi:two-component system sensor kinase FixL